MVLFGHLLFLPVDLAVDGQRGVVNGNGIHDGFGGGGGGCVVVVVEGGGEGDVAGGADVTEGVDVVGVAFDERVAGVGVVVVVVVN